MKTLKNDAITQVLLRHGRSPQEAAAYVAKLKREKNELRAKLTALRAALPPQRGFFS